MEKINVGLYGGKSIFGGKEEKLVAEIIYCENKDNCGLYKNGQCNRVRKAFSSNQCKYGSVSRIQGYTSRAQKYYTFKKTYTEDSEYSKLNSTTLNIALIGAYVFINTPFIRISEDGALDSPSFCSKESFIPVEKFTLELFYSILKYRPQAMMGGTITSHAKEEVPKLLIHCKQAMPEFFDKFTAQYPEFKELDYRGRRAFIYSLADGVKITYDGAEFMKDGESLEWVSGRPLNMFSSLFKHMESFRIRIDIDMWTEIKDNKIVDNNTIFKS